jgi:hypothetical protein
MDSSTTSCVPPSSSSFAACSSSNQTRWVRWCFPNNVLRGILLVRIKWGMVIVVVSQGGMVPMWEGHRQEELLMHFICEDIKDVKILSSHFEKKLWTHWNISWPNYSRMIVFRESNFVMIFIVLYDFLVQNRVWCSSKNLLIIVGDVDDIIIAGGQGRFYTGRRGINIVNNMVILSAISARSMYSFYLYTKDANNTSRSSSISYSSSPPHAQPAPTIPVAATCLPPLQFRVFVVLQILFTCIVIVGLDGVQGGGAGLVFFRREGLLLLPRQRCLLIQCHRRSLLNTIWCVGEARQTQERWAVFLLRAMLKYKLCLP